MKYFFALITPILLLVSCAKEVEETDEQIQQRLLEAFLEVECGNTITPTESGIYILDHIEGTGKQVEGEMGAFVYYTVESLDGSILEYNREETHKQMNDWDVRKEYVPEYKILGIEMLPIGEEEIMSMMKVGGKIRAVIPPSQQVTPYSTVSTGSVNKIYNIELMELTDDIFQYQIDSMERFTARNFPGLDSLEKGFYFKKIVESESDTIAYSSVVSVNYVGRFLSGKVFDTNIADTAKQHRFYSSSSSYTSLEVTYYENDETMSSENNSLVSGFVKALKQMKWGEYAVVYFWANLGYGENGSGNITPYSPILFEIWTEVKSDE